MNETILVVEDQAALLESNCDFLEDEGYETEGVQTLAEARRALVGTTFDLVLLDIMLPDGEGFDLVPDIPLETAILYLTGRVGQEDLIRGLSREGGRVDYLRKPFEYQEMGLRVRSLLAAGKPQMTTSITRGPLALDMVASRAFVDGKDLLLTPKEFALLHLFVKNENAVVCTDSLYEKVWGQEMNKDAGAVKYQVSNLRKKLEGSGYTISSARGKGYCFQCE